MVAGTNFSVSGWRSLFNESSAGSSPQRSSPVLNVSFDSPSEVDVGGIFDALDKKFPGKFSVLKPYVPHVSVDGVPDYRERINIDNEGSALIHFEAKKAGVFTQAYSNVPLEDMIYYLQSALPEKERARLFEQLRVQPLPEERMRAIEEKTIRDANQDALLNEKIARLESKGLPTTSIYPGDIGKALGVLQREGVYVKAGDMIDGREITHIGTQGVGPCIAAVIHHPGGENNPPSTAIMHVDSNTDVPGSMGRLLSKFPDRDNLQVSLLASAGDQGTARELVRFFDKQGINVLNVDLRGSSEYVVDVQTGRIDNDPATKVGLDFGKDGKRRLEALNLKVMQQGPADFPHDDDITRTQGPKPPKDRIPAPDSF